jgi:hypothetical protein
MEFDLDFSRFDEILTRSSCLHLDDISTHEWSSVFQISKFINLLHEFDLNFDFGYLESDYSMDLVLH